MTKPPDEKTQAELNAATNARKAGGKWRLRVAVAFTLVLLIAGGLFVVEAYRQSQINSARMEFAREVQHAQDRYADVNDWPQWYRDQLPSGTDHQDLAAWIKSCDQSSAASSAVGTWAASYDPDYTDENTPDAAQLQQFLEDTEPLVREARQMLRHQSVTRLPDFEDGLPDFSFIPALDAFKLLTYRALAFQQLGKLDQAWTELEGALRLAQKWDQPCAIVDLMIRAGAERLVHLRMDELAQLRPPPAALLVSLREQPEVRAGLKREVLEYELVYFSQLMFGFDSDDPQSFSYFYFEEGDEPVWFDYLSPTLDWDDRKDSFQARAMIFEAIADYLRQVRTTLETPGGSVENLDDTNPFLGSFTRIPSYLTQTALLRHGTALLCRVLLAQQNGELDSVMAQAVADYPDHEVYVDGESIVIRVRYSKRLAAELPCEDVSEDEFYEVYEPVRLPLKP